MITTEELARIEALYETSQPGTQGHLIYVVYNALPDLIALARDGLAFRQTREYKLQQLWNGVDPSIVYGDDAGDSAEPGPDGGTDA